MSALMLEDLIWAQLESEREAREHQRRRDDATERGDAEMIIEWETHLRHAQVRSERFRAAGQEWLDARARRFPRKGRQS